MPTIGREKVQHFVRGSRVVSSDDGVFQQEIVLDGLVYHITLCAEFGRYFASWTCLNCPLQDRSTMHGNTVDEAIAQARAILQDHHRRIHCNGQQAESAIPRGR
jgi:hypothetical protein